MRKRVTPKSKLRTGRFRHDAALFRTNVVKKDIAEPYPHHPTPARRDAIPACGKGQHSEKGAWGSELGNLREKDWKASKKIKR
ncbi:hypothetical protein Bwad004_23000 [Bilophila wadsworthia]